MVNTDPALYKNVTYLEQGGVLFAQYIEQLLQLQLNYEKIV
jgi:hypothetical protein